MTVGAASAVQSQWWLSSFWTWWIILYWPIMGFLIFLGTQLEKRYPIGSAQRNRTELALGFGILAMPGLPLIVAIGSILLRNPTEPPVLVIEAIVVFNLALLLFFGGLWLLAKWRVRGK